MKPEECRCCMEIQACRDTMLRFETEEKRKCIKEHKHSMRLYSIPTAFLLISAHERESYGQCKPVSEGEGQQVYLLRGGEGKQ